jgi:hypothetical protein
MNISNEEAQAALDAVKETQKRLQRAISEEYAGLIMLWGVIWTLGSLSLHFLGGPRGGLVFGILDVVGIAATICIVHRSNKQGAIRGPQTRVLYWHIWGMWIALALYGTLWGLVLKPNHNNQLSFYLCTLAMFGYVIMGLWTLSNFLVWLGLGTTAVVVAGYYLVPDFFQLWMAVLGGGTLCATGLYIRKYWR